MMATELDYGGMTDTGLVDSYMSNYQMLNLLNGDAAFDQEACRERMTQILKEFSGRGLGDEQNLANDANARSTALMATDVNDLTDNEVTLRYLLGGMGAGAAQAVAAALNANPDDVKGAGDVAGGRQALEAGVTVRSLDSVPEVEDKTNGTAQFADSAVVTLGQSWLLSKVSNLFGGRGSFLGTMVSLGGSKLLSSGGSLTNSFVPILEVVRDVLPESMKGIMDPVIDALKPKTEEEKAAERFDTYTTLAVGDSMESIKQAGDVTSESLREAMRVNGEFVATNGIMANMGADGKDSEVAKEGMGSVRDVVGISTEAAEAGFDARIAAGEDCSEDMRYYYMSLFEGLDGYNEGVRTGIDTTYAVDDPARAQAEAGLGYTNGVYCDEAMTSLRAADAKYHFMTEEDWAKLDSYEFVGVEGPLSEYVPQAQRTATLEQTEQQPDEFSEEPSQEEQANLQPINPQEEEEDETVKSTGKTESKKLQMQTAPGAETHPEEEKSGNAELNSSQKDPEQAKAEADAKHEERVRKAEELKERVTNAKEAVKEALEIGN